MLSPVDLPGCVAWYDFSTPNNVFKDAYRLQAVTANNDLVGSATDLSGQGNHLTLPLNSTAQGSWKSATGTINFGIPNYLMAPDSPSLSLLQGTIFAVCQTTQTNVGRYIVAKMPSGAATIEYGFKTAVSETAMTLEVKNGTDGTATTAGSPAGNDGNNHIWMGTFSSGALSVWMDNAQNATSTTAAVFDGTGDLVVGGDHGSAGYTGAGIGEVIIYNRVMKASQRAQINTYLADKWNVTLGTPTTRTIRNSVDGKYDTYHLDGSLWGNTDGGVPHNKVSTVTGTKHGTQDSHRDTDRATAEAR